MALGVARAYIAGMSAVTVRFAPSPTGFLHIGGARTALFNWLFARHHRLYGDGGTFRLRIEDTDRQRSTPEAVAAIIDGLSWLGLDWDGEVVHQFARAERHAEAARLLLAQGRAYRCYCTPAELEAMREQARAEKRSVHIDSPWRDSDPKEAPPGVAPVIRLRAPQQGATTISDLVQGEVTVANAELDDLILLRADGTPTYNLSVVVDDHDMAITHVIRGDDHLRNAFRQTQIYRALDWPVPEFGHVPLIHGADGAKLSKRHGAIGVEQYRELGYLPEALRNYLMRLGWSHGDDEIIATEDAIRWFDIAAVGRSAARFDQAKLDNVNAHYIRATADARLVALVAERLEREFGRPLSAAEHDRLLRGMPGLKPRAKTIVELTERTRFYVVPRPVPLAADAAKVLNAESRERLATLAADLTPLDDAGWTAEILEGELRQFVEAQGIKFGAVAQPLRAALTGSLASPGLFEVMDVLGREESLARIDDAVSAKSAP
jgi:glutamyl-tRNA synthetase